MQQSTERPFEDCFQGKSDEALPLSLPLLNMEPIKTVKGNNGQLTLYADKICISRKGMLAFMLYGLKGDKEIFISQISSIQLKKAGLTAGYIQFAFLGGQEAKGGLFQGVKDENTVSFVRGNNKDFEEIKTLIEQQIAKIKHGGASSGTSGLEDLKVLKKLKDEGVITEQEFTDKKRKILGL